VSTPGTTPTRQGGRGRDADRGAGRGPGAEPLRRCSRTACGRNAVATLTYVYSDSTAVLGPLATYAEPHCYDLCAEHADRLTAPRGWEVVRLAPGMVEAARNHDDILAVADAVRDRPSAPRTPAEPAPGTPVPPGTRRGHLRALRDEPRTGG